MCFERSGKSFTHFASEHFTQKGNSRSGYWINMSLLIFLLVVIKTEGFHSINEVPNPINITFIDSAVSKGAGVTIQIKATNSKIN